MYEQIARNKRLAVFYVALFFVIWLGIGAAVGYVGAAATARPYEPQPDVSGAVVLGMLVAGSFAALGILYTLTSGSGLVLAVSGAQEADPELFPQLHHIVEALAIGDGMPKPAVYVIDDPSPNAFATGTSPNKAAITATTGLLEIMNREEVEGV